MITRRRDPTSVVWRRCFAAGTGAVLTVVALVTTLLVAGDVRVRKNGCPKPVPKGHDCFAFRSNAYVMRGSVALWFVVALVIAVIVLFVVPQVLFGCTLGKAIFGVRVVRPDGSAPGALRSLVRIVAWVVDGLALVLPVGLWLAIFTTGHRRVGDFLAATYVVRRSDIGQPVRIPPRGPILRWRHRD